MHEYILRNWRIVKVATTKAQRKLFFNLRGAKRSLSWLSAEETKAIAQDLGVTAEEVNRMEGRLSASDMAFDGYATDDDTKRPRRCISSRRQHRIRRIWSLMRIHSVTSVYA